MECTFVTELMCKTICGIYYKRVPTGDGTGWSWGVDMMKPRSFQVEAKVIATAERSPGRATKTRRV